VQHTQRAAGWSHRFIYNKACISCDPGLGPWVQVFVPSHTSSTLAVQHYHGQLNEDKVHVRQGYLRRPTYAGLPTRGYLRRATFAGLPTQGYLRRATFAGLPLQGGHLRRATYAGLYLRRATFAGALNRGGGARLRGKILDFGGLGGPRAAGKPLKKVEGGSPPPF